MILIIEKSISAALGKGSFNHNRRQFNAKNTDPNRTPNNITYKDESIKKAYHQLFDNALKKYNKKQTRADRKIKNYYDKIASGKQEKTFHELILQIGNKDDTPVGSSDANIATHILDEYIKSFEERNPYLHVFGAYLHLDEATPHLHIDFIPFSTGNIRGLETRVSLKAALKQQGFIGTSKFDSEWSAWTTSEKEVLSKIMLKHGISWKQLDTHNEHLSVIDYKKQERQKELQSIEDNLKSLEEKRDALTKENIELKNNIENIKKDAEEFEKDIEDSGTFKLIQVDNPKPFMSIKKYKETIVDPIIKKAQRIIASLFYQIRDLTKEMQKLLDYNKRLENSNHDLYDDNHKLYQKLENYDVLIDAVGGDNKANRLIDKQLEKYELERQFEERKDQFLEM